MQVLKQSTAFNVTVGPVLDSDGVAVTGAVIGDFKLSKNGGAPAALNGSATATHRHTGVYSIGGTTSDSDTVGTLEITLDKTTDAMQPARFQVVEESIYVAFYASGAEAITEADVQTAAEAALAAYTAPTLAQAQAAVTGGLAAINLDHLFGAVDTDWATTVNATSALGLMASKDGSNTFDRTTNSLESIAETLEIVSGTIANASTNIVDLGALGLGDDELNDHLIRIFDNSTSEYHSRWIDDYDGTDSLAQLHSALPFTTESGVDTWVIYANRRNNQVIDLSTKVGTPAGASVSADIADIEGKVDDLETRLGTPSNLGSGATVAANLVDIESQTDDIGAAGAGLTALATQASVDTIDNFLDTEIAAILALLDDPRGEPGQGAPPVNPDLATKIDYLYKAWRNKKTQTSTQFSLFADDATTVDQKSATSDDGTTFTAGEMAAGP